MAAYVLSWWILQITTLLSLNSRAYIEKGERYYLFTKFIFSKKTYTNETIYFRCHH